MRAKTLTKLALLLGLSLFIVLPVCSHDTWSTVQNPAAHECLGASAACLATVTSTGAGNLLTVVAGFATNAETVSSCCNAGCAVSWAKADSSNSSLSIELWYCTSSSSGATSIGPTWGANCSTSFCYTAVREFSSTLGTIAINSGATPHCNSSGSTANPSACSLTTSANNSVYIAGIFDNTNPTAINQSYTGTFANGFGEAFNINLTSYTAPTWTVTANNWNQVAAAFQETSAANTFEDDSWQQLSPRTTDWPICVWSFILGLLLAGFSIVRGRHEVNTISIIHDSHSIGVLERLVSVTKAEPLDQGSKPMDHVPHTQVYGKEKIS